MAFVPASDYRMEETQRLILKASLTYKVGDLVAVIGSGTTLYYNELSNESTYTAGAVYPVGVLIGFSKANGEVISQGQDPTNTPNQLTTLSTNLTVDKYYGVFLPIKPEMKWIGDLGAAAVTTNYSAQAFTYFGLTDCRTIDETSAVAGNSAASTSQILSLGLVEDSNQPVSSGSISRKRIYCKIIKSAWNRAYTG